MTRRRNAPSEAVYVPSDRGTARDKRDGTPRMDQIGERNQAEREARLQALALAEQQLQARQKEDR